MERRGATRYQLRLAVTYSWKNEAGAVLGSEGQTRDLNSRGIYVQTNLIPPIGSYVEMHVLLPALVKRPGELHAEGRVVRMDAAAGSSQPSGFAAMNHTVTLRDAEGHEINEQDSWKEFGIGGIQKIIVPVYRSSEAMGQELLV